LDRDHAREVLTVLANDGFFTVDETRALLFFLEHEQHQCDSLAAATARLRAISLSRPDALCE
jgi:hypothetical protein